MSTALESLLGPPGPGVPAHCRTLRSPDGIHLRLISNAQDDQLMLLSSPGLLPPDTDRTAVPAHWQHTLDHPHRVGVRISVVLCPGSRRLHLADVWPRQLATPPVLLELLDEHCRRHRLWNATLQGPGVAPGAHVPPLPPGQARA